MATDTLPALLQQWADEYPDEIWLRDLHEQSSDEYSWSAVRDEVDAVSAAVEKRFGAGNNMVLLSRNCAHWFMADLAIISAGNVTIPLFTTLAAGTAQYVMEFTEAPVVFVGESPNWPKVAEVLPEGVTLVTLPGVTIDQPHLRWEDLLAEGKGHKPAYVANPDDMISLVFTSGTTGVPKGVIQTHNSNLIPIRRFLKVFELKERARYLSYLPLSHIAERQIVEYSSLVCRGEVNFNQSLETIVPDLQRTRPHVFFGPPRVWEQFQQAVLAKFGGAEAMEAAMAQDKEGIGQLVVAGLGMDEVIFCLTAAAPTPPALIRWYRELGLPLTEGFGQTEAMGVILNTPDSPRIGSIGKPIGEVEFKLSEEDELLIKAEGLTPGYYKAPEKTAELLQNGWLHTGDKARVDEDGYVFLTGRVKDYFKTIQGKFVAPAPLENAFAASPHTEQLCLLGRGYSKTVMVAVLSETAAALDNDEIEHALRQQAQAVNQEVEKHQRMGAVILTREAWTIENEVLTPTMKIKRDKVEARFGEIAQALALQSAEQGELLLHWE